MKRIIVTGAGGPATSNFIKSLRMATEKFYIVGTDTNRFHLWLSNTDKSYVFPPVSSTAYMRNMNYLIKKEKIGFIHPQPDAEVSFISERRERLGAKTFLPSKKTVRICQDKLETYGILKKNKVPVGESYFINSQARLRSAIGNLLKNNEKAWLRAIRGAGSRASLPVRCFAHAKFWIDYWKEMKGIGYGDFMLSEFLPGREYAFQSIWNAGEIITSQARERLEYVFGNLTPSGQTSSPSVARTVWNEDVNEIAAKGILAVDPNATGIFCVDMKEDKDGIPCITEINAGRFFTTSNFLSEAGINMPYLYIKMAFGERLPEMKRFNSVPEGLYWVRQIDMGYKLVSEKEFSKSKLPNKSNICNF